MIAWRAYGELLAGDDVVLKHAVTLDQSPPALNSFTNTAALTFTGWGTKLIATHIFVNDTITHLAQGATAVDPGSGEWVPDNRVSLVCSNLTVAATHAIHGDKAGFTGVVSATGRGPGGGTVNRGGGYGGAGGAGGGPPYGDAHAPTNAGSAGGGAPNDGGIRGGRGGGAIRMEVEKTLALNGAITANGNPYGSTASGAGSGGSAWIIARKFGGVGGVVSANGGNAHPTGTGGGGGGGRVAIWRASHEFDGSVTAEPGAAGAGFPGVEGSVVFVDIPAAGTVMVIR